MFKYKPLKSIKYYFICWFKHNLFYENQIEKQPMLVFSLRKYDINIVLKQEVIC